jgi:hypothetical protein
MSLATALRGLDLGMWIVKLIDVLLDLGFGFLVNGWNVGTWG